MDMHLNHTRQASTKSKSSSGHKVMQGISLLNLASDQHHRLVYKRGKFHQYILATEKGVAGHMSKEDMHLNTTPQHPSSSHSN
jgi:hypothetical protein